MPYPPFAVRWKPKLTGGVPIQIRSSAMPAQVTDEGRSPGPKIGPPLRGRPEIPAIAGMEYGPWSRRERGAFPPIANLPCLMEETDLEGACRHADSAKANMQDVEGAAAAALVRGVVAGCSRSAAGMGRRAGAG